MSDIDGMVPRTMTLFNKHMYLFHKYRTRENQDFGDRQMYWYSFPDVRRTSYTSITINHG